MIKNNVCVGNFPLITRKLVWWCLPTLDFVANTLDSIRLHCQVFKPDLRCPSNAAKSTTAQGIQHCSGPDGRQHAQVHHGNAATPGMIASLNRRGISILFLPKYSPELNPCELVFAQVRKWLRTHRDINRTFLSNLLTAFGQVTRDNIIGYYRRCIRYFAEHSLSLPPFVFASE